MKALLLAACVLVGCGSSKLSSGLAAGGADNAAAGAESSGGNGAFVNGCSAARAQLLGAIETVSTGSVQVLGDAAGSKTLYVDATAGGQSGAPTHPWTFIALGDATKVAVNDVTSLQSSAWDLAFKRAQIYVNGGEGGPGNAGSAFIHKDFADVTSADMKDAEFLSEKFFDDDCNPIVDVTGAASTSFSAWYDYDAATHVLSPVDGTWLLRGATGKAFKLRIESYYSTPSGDTGSAGGAYLLKSGLSSVLVRVVLRALLGALLAAPSALAGECTRPSEPGGGGGYDYGKAQLSSFGNDQVLVWYVTDGEHAVNSASSRSDHVPNDVATVAEVTRDALASYSAMGLRAPLSDALSPECGPNGGDQRFDVYLVNMRGADGMAVAESGRCMSGSPKQCATYLVAKANYAEYYDTAEIGIRTVLPHETFHAVQNAYDTELDRFWAEGSAQWAAKTLDPTLLDLERNLPAFFSQSARSLDAPPSGVTTAFLYGSAIWPVFLSQRYGDDIVRAILEQEAEQGDSAILATDTVLHTLQSSVADEYSLFAAWNSATGARTGVGGYSNAMAYPEVDVSELSAAGAQAITSGLASFYFHVRTEAPMQVLLDTDSSRNRGLFVPFANGLPQVARVKPLPTELESEGMVIVSGITSSKKDAPFTVSLRAPAASSTNPSGGCSLSPPAKAPRLPERFALLLALVAATVLSGRRAHPAQQVSSAREAGVLDTPNPSPR